jgi:hypothetical protein
MATLCFFPKKSFGQVAAPFLLVPSGENSSPRKTLFNSDYRLMLLNFS